MNAEDDYSLERRYKRAREKVRILAKMCDKRKEAYLTAMFNIERKVIKAKLALNPEITRKAQDDIWDVTKKARALKEKYVDQLLKWRNKFVLFIELAKEKGYIDKESGYLGNGILSNMTEIARFSLEKTSNVGVKLTEDKVLNMDIFLEKEKIREPVFEDYLPAGNKNEMYESATCEIDTAKEDWGYDSDTSETYCQEGDKAPTTFAKVHKLPSAWKSHICDVIKDYQKKKLDELNLHIGEKVKHILPADNSGMAFGVKKYGLIRKKKGFFPMSHVRDEIFADVARGSRKSRKEHSRNNPIFRILDAFTEPKTKIALLKEAVADDGHDGAKVYTEKKKQNNVFTRKNWLKIYGIDISDDEPYEVKKSHSKPTRIQSAKKISSKKYKFSKRRECVLCDFNIIENGAENGELVLEDIDGTVEQQEDDVGDDRLHVADADFQFVY